MSLKIGQNRGTSQFHTMGTSLRTMKILANGMLLKYYDNSLVDDPHSYTDWTNYYDHPIST